MPERLVSTVMPCYNQADYAKEAIESVLNQTYKNIELILIDNFSTDGTREIIQQFEKRDQRIKAVYHKENLRFEASFTEGMKIAKGEYIAFTSSDDIWMPEKIEEQVRTLNEKTDYDVVHSDAVIIDTKGLKKGTIKQAYRLNIKEATGDVLYPLTKKNICCTSTVMIRRKCLETANEWDPKLRFAHDWWLYIQYAKKHKFFYIDKALASYRVHATNTTKKTKWVYNDYGIIHSRIAEMGIDPKEHLISAALAYSRIGMVNEAREKIEQARKKGKLDHKERIIAFVIKNFDDMSKPLEALNKIRHLSLGIVYQIKNHGEKDE